MRYKRNPLPKIYKLIIKIAQFHADTTKRIVSGKCKMSADKANLLSGVDARTKLVGHNRLELLLFRLQGPQRYGINVFKVREVVSCPTLTKLPDAHEAVLGIANMRGNTFMVIDLQKAIKYSATEDIENAKVIVAEYNRKLQGFLVPNIEFIANQNWEDIQPPPKIAGSGHYLTGVTRIDDDIVEILDVEKILYEITGKWTENEPQEISPESELGELIKRCHVLVVDDSSMARKQIKRTLDKVGVSCTCCNDGKAALDKLIEWAEADSDEYLRLALIISDVEMPVMDGYTLTHEIRNNPMLSDLPIVLHTSLSGVFDSSLLDKVAADGFLSKFDSEELANIVTQKIRDFESRLVERGL